MTHPTTEQLDSATWFKSSYSGGAGNECVEVARGAGWVGVRDSKNPTGPVLTFPTSAFTSLLSTWTS